MIESVVSFNGKLGMALASVCSDAGFMHEDIVRCRDCAYAIDGGKRCDNAYLLDVDPDGFCSAGKRKDDEMKAPKRLKPCPFVQARWF